MSPLLGSLLLLGSLASPVRVAEVLPLQTAPETSSSRAAATSARVIRARYLLAESYRHLAEEEAQNLLRGDRHRSGDTQAFPGRAPSLAARRQPTNTSKLAQLLEPARDQRPSVA